MLGKTPKVTSVPDVEESMIVQEEAFMNSESETVPPEVGLHKSHPDGGEPV